MAKVAFEDAAINVWKPMKEGLPHIAMIGSLPMVFSAPTVMGAKKAAQEWRQGELEKAEARRIAQENREAGLRAAREARRLEKE